MRDLQRGQSNQMIAIQNNMASGNAQTSPRAKLRRGPRADSRGRTLGSRNGPSMTSVLSMLLNQLPLLGRWVRLSGQSRQFRELEPESAARGSLLRSLARASGLSSIGEELSAIVTIIRLSARSDPESQRQMEHIIYLGDCRKTRRRRMVVRKVAVISLCVFMARPAFAEDVKVQTPVDLFLPESTSGVRLSPTMVLHANVEATDDYDSNIYNIENNKTSDAIAIIKPLAVISSDWSRHSLALQASGEIRRYADNGSENSEQYDLRGLGSLDLGERMHFSAEGGYASLIEPRGTVGDTLFTDRPIEFNKSYVGAELSRTGGILELIVGGTITKLNYSNSMKNGVPIDLGFRDVVVREGSIRTNYRLSPKVSAYVQVNGNQVDYSQNLGPRNSSGYAVFGGLHYEISRLVDIEGAVGYLRQNFDDPLAKSANGLTFQLNASWTPTPMWKITGVGKRSVEPSPLPTLPAIIHTDFELKAQRAVSDKVLVEAGGAYVIDDFREVNRKERRFISDVAVSYRVSENVLASVHGGYRTRSSNITGLSYDGFAVGVTLRGAI